MIHPEKETLENEMLETRRWKDAIEKMIEDMRKSSRNSEELDKAKNRLSAALGHLSIDAVNAAQAYYRK